MIRHHDEAFNRRNAAPLAGESADRPRKSSRNFIGDEIPRQAPRILWRICLLRNLRKGGKAGPALERDHVEKWPPVIEALEARHRLVHRFRAWAPPTASVYFAFHVHGHIIPQAFLAMPLY